MIIATVDRRLGETSKDKAPNRKRSLVFRFGAFLLARLNTMSCCLSIRFSAMTALAPPDLSDFANSTKRCMKRKATDFMSGMLSRHPTTTRLGFDLIFCSDYQFAMHTQSAWCLVILRMAICTFSSGHRRTERITIKATKSFMAVSTDYPDLCPTRHRYGEKKVAQKQP